MTGDIERYLVVGAVLFVLGAIGFFTRRNLILMVLSGELMLHGVSLTLVTFGRVHRSLEGQAFTIFILTVAACEAGLALSLILALYQKSKSLDIDFWSDLREPGLPSPRVTEAAERLYETPESIKYPTLTPAGRVPEIRNPHDENVVSRSHSHTADTPQEPAAPKDMKDFVSR
jgi:NADH-quinone oxidoreductase subunit K